MPLLAPSELPAHLASAPRRVLVAGTSGAGKTALAARIATALSAPHTEIDSLFHGEGWTPRPTFEADVEAFSGEPTWVTEWQYSAVRPLLAERADLLVWLDLPRPAVMRQVVRRTVGRRVRREVLWNGNTEPALHTFFTDEDHIVRWAWRSYAPNRAHVTALAASRPELVIARATSHREADEIVRALTRVALSR